jgi:acyl dehydratase
MEIPFKQYWDDCELDDRVVTPGRTITETDVVMFAALTGDWNSVHSDREFAKKNTPFRERIAHGLLGVVVGSCLLSRLGWFAFWPQSMICITGIDKVRFLLPILIGDTIYLEATIIDKKLMRGDEGLITTRMRIINQRGEKAISMQITLKAKRRPKV